MLTSIIGFPRVGNLRELKFATEKYFKHQISQERLQTVAKEIREKQWRLLKENGIDLIPSNDFSFYDTLLDSAALFNIIPSRYKELNYLILILTSQCPADIKEITEMFVHLL